MLTQNLLLAALLQEVFGRLNMRTVDLTHGQTLNRPSQTIDTVYFSRDSDRARKCFNLPDFLGERTPMQTFKHNEKWLIVIHARTIDTGNHSETTFDECWTGEHWVPQAGLCKQFDTEEDALQYLRKNASTMEKSRLRPETPWAG